MSATDTLTMALAISQYRKHGMFNEATMYYGGLWVGSTRASVGG